MLLGKGYGVMLDGGWTLPSAALPSPKACAVQRELPLTQLLLPGSAASLTNRGRRYEEHSAHIDKT